MVDATHTSYPAADRSYYAILKKDIHHKAQEAGLISQKLAALDIILAELTSNLHKYATDGEILIGFGKDHKGEYLEVIAIDNGPGMADTAKMMQDGYSTGSTMGHGLGSIKRLSDKFDLFSIKGWGTIVLSRIYKNEQDAATVKPVPAIEIRPLVVAKTGEQVSGDATYYKTSGRYLKLLVADGLGHGREANLAVNEAVSSFKGCPYDSPVEILRFLHQDIRKTRGMVSTVAVFDLESKQVQIAGIGNISAKFMHLGGIVKNHISYNGIVGHNIPNTMNSQQVAFTDYSLLILCSDGIKSRWDVSKYQGIARCDSMMMAAAIYKDYSRGTDDTSVVIVKLK
ncbi:SpoIIE family protein phosphatase [Mucilaginibacter robiniae]|uniref:SpoIIE family protein phosphatase n=1 Tax=Mucilaginibacter robiniae TaxID=2728022 RepID=A0A7L5E341_9SPHI|nr:SpoIIE family protein phosphatase [Mucilaginibacter robiniae]QJD96978.1 SpoIIE family protein phosphatase [Mucilaginibacter robiniae]